MWKACEAQGVTPMGDYVWQRSLGKGGYGQVHLVKHRDTGEFFALKIVRVDASTPGALERAKREVEVQKRAAQASPYVAKVHAWGQAGECYFWFAMDYCSGGDLSQRVVDGEGVADRPWMLRATREVLEGLCAMHARDITHLDLKPENILLTADGHVRITDCGLARILGDDSATQTRGGGTRAYMAPEVNTNRFSNKADIFSVAVLFGELLSGRHADIGADDPVGELLDAAAPRDAPTEAMFALTRFMLHAKSSDRPTAEEALAKLDELTAAPEEGADEAKARGRFSSTPRRARERERARALRVAAGAFRLSLSRARRPPAPRSAATGARV